MANHSNLTTLKSSRKPTLVFFLKEGIKQALIKQVENGVDNINRRMLKARGKITSKRLLHLFQNIRKTISLPGDWKKSIIVRIPRNGNGDLTWCANSILHTLEILL